MSFLDVMRLIGGLGMFLYGMKIMGDGLESAAGSKMKTIIENLTGKVWRGVLVGTAVTGIIQSSSATTVMVVGFVNAGIMTLKQAAAVIMGANIGTTVTAQILRLGDISSDSIALQLLKPASLASVALLIGIVLIMFIGKGKTKDIGYIFVGFGILFFGMMTMESSVKMLADNETFQQLLVSFRNPVFGIIAGALFTALIQSSSASVGVLQAMAATGIVPFSVAMPVILGQNIGTCITAILSSISANRNAKRAAMIHLYFNLIGSVVFIIAIYTYHSIVGIPFYDTIVNRGDIANFHTVFNIVNTALMLPFLNGLIRLAEITIPGGRSKEKNANRLDERFLGVPYVALEQCRLLVGEMSGLVVENMKYAKEIVCKYSGSLLSKMEDNENDIDKMEDELGRYLVQIADRDLSEAESKIATEILHTIGDYERMGDYIENIGESATEADKKGLEFSGIAQTELLAMFDAVEEIISLTNSAYQSMDISIAKQVEPLEEVIDLFKETLRTNHVNRLRTGGCTVESGIIFLEIVTNLERIADHCSSVAVYIFQMKQTDYAFDPHEYIKNVHNGDDTEFQAFFKYYEDKYYNKISL